MYTEDSIVTEGEFRLE